MKQPITAISVDIDRLETDLSVYVKASDLDQEEFNRTILIESLGIEADRVYEVFGTWKSGKTTVALDLAASCSLGLNWAGGRTVQALVVYVAGESVEDIKIRLAAWRKFHQETSKCPFYVRTKPVFLTDEVFAHLLATEIGALKSMHPGLPVIVVIDTLARNFGPGAKEDNEGMGRFVNNLIDIVVRPTKATALVVHHSGHTESDRGRGGSIFEAAIDGAVKVSMDKSSSTPTVTVATTLSRNTAGNHAASFEIITQIIPGSDNFGNAIEAPVLNYLDDYQPKEKTAGLGKKQHAVLDLLKTLYAEYQERIDNGKLNTIARVSKSELRTEALKRNAETDKSNFYKTVTKLIGRGLIRDENGFLFVNDTEGQKNEW